MTVVSIAQAKAQLSELIDKALRGEDVVIADGEVPKVRLTPVAQAVRRRFGALKGVVSMDEAFFDPLPGDELAGLRGSRP